MRPGGRVLWEGKWKPRILCEHMLLESGACYTEWSVSEREKQIVDTYGT